MNKPTKAVLVASAVGFTLLASVFIILPGDTNAQQAVFADIKANGSDAPITIQPGQSATLTWTSQNATSCDITPGGFTGTSGTATVTPSVTQTYILVCQGPGAEFGSNMVTVNVGSVAAPTADIKANGSDGPISIQLNTAANLTWTSTNATSCTVNPGGFTGVSGSASTGNLANSQTFTVTCTGAGGTATDNVTVNVINTPIVITADIKANGSDVPITIQANTAATLTWTSTGATACTVNPGGFTGTSGTASTGNLSNTQTFTVTCTAPGANPASDSVTVNVQAQQVTADIKANGSDTAITIPFNASANLTWTSSGATVCTVTPGNFVGISGSAWTGNLTQSTTFTLSCRNEFNQTANDSVTVNVQQGTITADIKANGSDSPITIQANTAATLTWTSTNANQCTVNPNGFIGTSGTASTGNLNNSQTYTLTCTGAAGTATDTVTVNVQNQGITADIKANGQDSAITIPSNTSAILTWTSTGASFCSVTPGGFTGTSGSASTGNLTFSQTYTLNCSGSGGSAVDSVTVLIQNTQNVTADIKANGQDGTVTIPFNTSAILSWTSSNASFCSINPGGFTGTSGSASTGNLTNSQTYVLNCSGQGGTATDSVTVNVSGIQGNQPTVDITANPRNINQGQSATLTWFSNNATSCSASGGWSGQKNLSGSETVTPFISTTYTITCVNNFGVATDSDFVTVGGISNTQNITVTKTVRNITLGQTFFSNNVEAQGLDNLEFEIRVRNNDVNSTTVTVRDILPQELFYVSGSTTVDGQFVQDGITSGGITLNTLSPGQERVIRFRAVVFFGTAQGSVTNQATAVTSSGASQSGFATITIRNRGRVLGVGSIVTGPSNPMPWMLVLGFTGAMAMHIAVFKRRMRIPFFSSFAGVEPETDLEKRLREIRARERGADTDTFTIA